MGTSGMDYYPVSIVIMQILTLSSRFVNYEMGKSDVVHVHVRYSFDAGHSHGFIKLIFVVISIAKHRFDTSSCVKHYIRSMFFGTVYSVLLVMRFVFQHSYRS